MRLRVVLQVVAAAVAFGAALAFFLPPNAVGGAADDAAAGWRADIFGARDMGDAEVVVLALDERSVNDPTLATTPRALMTPVWAEIAEKALANGARKIGFDFILAFDGGDLTMAGERPLARYDAPFLQILRKEARAGRVVIGRSQDLLPARRFRAMAREAGVAFLDFDTDGDGVARRIATRFQTSDGKTAFTLSGAILGAEAPPLIPITPPGPLTSLPTASVIDVLGCDDDDALRALFENRIVFVGGALPGEDRFRAPDRLIEAAEAEAPGPPCAFAAPALRGSGGDTPGVYLHAAAVDAALSGWALSPAPTLAVVLVAAAAAALAGFAALTFSPWTAAAATLIIGVFGFAGAVGAQEAGMLFPAARAGFAALVGFIAGWLGRLLFLDRRARALRASFGRYIAPELVERILAQEKLPELEGEERRITVMFADLSGFTALSEQVDGKTLTTTVNRYLSIIAREVERSGGYVDKFIGDAVMAIWNAPAIHPDHERVAVRTAMAIRDAVAAAAEEDARNDLPNFAIKIGVNAGKAIVGNVGDENRLNYTAVGDTVNIAARFESLPSQLHTPIVLGYDCALAASDEWAMLEVASIQVKGREEPVAVLAPLEESDRPFFDRYDAALAAYRARAFREASEGWRALEKESWSGAALSSAMAGFADHLDAEPPGPSWDGAVIMTSK